MVKGTPLITEEGFPLSLIFVIHVCCARELSSAILSHISLPSFPALFSPVLHVCLHLYCVLHRTEKNVVTFFLILVCEAIGTAATPPGLLCQPRVIVKMIVEKQMECRLAGETEVLGENLPQRRFCPSQNPT
jgi:hypothetical protein